MIHTLGNVKEGNVKEGKAKQRKARQGVKSERRRDLEAAEKQMGASDEPFLYIKTRGENMTSLHLSVSNVKHTTLKGDCTPLKGVRVKHTII